MNTPRSAENRPFVEDTQFMRGLEVGISLASSKRHTTREWGMGARFRNGILRGLEEDERENESIQTQRGVVIHVHEQGNVTVHNGIDADTIERLIKLAQGREAAA